MDKEKILEFLKFDFRKGIIFSLIFIFSFLSLRGCCSCCPPWVDICILMCCPCYNPITWPYFWVIRPTNVFSDPVGIFLSVIYWYLLSCLIIYALNKLKKRK